ncbi:splicing factor 3B subunit 5-like [Dysidea avara]|uniref:splicing factor 3B subunit 5-like n=1 Tax=Dysidea avara TaxID=196820 RepID=UPI003334034E
MTLASERYNIHSQLEHLQSKYVGTGHADLSKYEWMVNQHRDSFASFIGHHDMVSYFSLVENESKARTKFNLMQKMLLPCGLPPEKQED